MVLPEEVTIPCPVKKQLKFYGIQTFIARRTACSYLSLPEADSRPYPQVFAPPKTEARKNTHVSHFIYLGKKHIYSIFKTCFVISGLLSIKCCLFHNFTFLSNKARFP